MCINPINFGSYPAPCRKCWQCRLSYVNDWVGRCIAESESSAASFVVTLTYRPSVDNYTDDPKATTLTLRDVQNYIKRIRARGYVVRFFAAGEYGSEKGRAHWHVILFFKDAYPNVDLGVNINDEYWPHGFSMWDKLDAAGVKYALKYIRKDADKAESQSKFTMSQRPPLGTEYFCRLAKKYARQGLAPNHYIEYRFGEVIDRKRGRPQVFVLRGVAGDIFWRAFESEWIIRHGTTPIPVSDSYMRYLDKMTNLVRDPILEPRQVTHKKPWVPPPEGCTVDFDEALNAWFYWDKRVPECPQIFWSYDENGERAWRDVLVLDAQATAIRDRIKLLADPAPYQKAKGRTPIGPTVDGKRRRNARRKSAEPASVTRITPSGTTLRLLTSRSRSPRK